MYKAMDFEFLLPFEMQKTGMSVSSMLPIRTSQINKKMLTFLDLSEM